MTVIYGDAYDAVIQSVLISHWFEVFKLHHVWNEPLYFYPYPDVLGYNDGYFINGLIASVYRLFGFNLLLSNEFCSMTIRTIGFFSMAALLRRLKCGDIVSILGAALFTLSLAISVHAGNGQLLDVSFAPGLALLLLNAVRSIDKGNVRSAFWWLAGFIVLYGAFLMSGFYMAWFFGLFTILFVVALAVVDFDYLKGLVCRSRALLWYLPALSFIALISVAPFLYVYLATLKSTGGQTYEAQKLYMLYPIDIFNAGLYSAIWHSTFAALDQKLPGLFRIGVTSNGFTPDVIAAMAVIAAVLLLRKWKSVPRAYVALALAVSVGLLLPLTVGGYSPWFLVNVLIPGARGMRVVGRFYLFLSFPVAVLIAVFMSRLKLWFSTIAMLVLCATQVNASPYVALNVPAEMAIAEHAGQPPASCKSFYVVNPSASTSETELLYKQNMHAMLLADRFDLPTLNGFASFNPPDWVFRQQPDYQEKVKAYILAHRLENVCAYDLGTGAWSR
ncbi:hypothetical protein [Caballeronia sp. KNU42]